MNFKKIGLLIVGLTILFTPETFAKWGIGSFGDNRKTVQRNMKNRQRLDPNKKNTPSVSPKQKKFGRASTRNQERRLAEQRSIRRNPAAPPPKNPHAIRRGTKTPGNVHATRRQQNRPSPVNRSTRPNLASPAPKNVHAIRRGTKVPGNVHAIRKETNNLRNTRAARRGGVRRSVVRPENLRSTTKLAPIRRADALIDIPEGVISWQADYILDNGIIIRRDFNQIGLYNIIGIPPLGQEHHLQVGTMVRGKILTKPIDLSLAQSPSEFAKEIEKFGTINRIIPM